MRRLPKLTAGTSTWALPLSEVAAGALADVFLRDASQQYEEQLARSIADEPPLILWSVCFADRWQTTPPAGIASIAAWIMERGLSAFQWSADQRELNPATDQTQLEKWCQLAEKSVSVAQSTSRLVESKGLRDESHEQAYLFALLHAAEQWLSSCGPSVSVPACKPGITCLPNWLVSFLQEVNQVPPRTFLAATVAQAASRLTTKPSIDAPCKDARQDEASMCASARPRSIRERWFNSSGHMGHLLPALTRRLARLRQLEDDFQKTLETEKLESLKALAYGASHEINNPLANISTRAQTLLRDETDPERRQKLAVINTQAFRAYEMI
ncbi:MAG: hypothetical protein JJ992_10245, partial [Planctomycetes bacterium]|nr:hypothetical protein [Planctomycetota bacterium]